MYVYLPLNLGILHQDQSCDGDHWPPKMIVIYRALKSLYGADGSRGWEQVYRKMGWV